MHRELGDERSRYGRRSLREQIDDVIAWPAGHQVATGVILVVVVGALLLVVARGRPASLGDLAVGDCLYVPTAAAQDSTSLRPIGEAGAVEEVLLTVGGQLTACTASHGHEVSAIVAPTLPTPAPDQTPGLLDEAAMREMTAPLCDEAFAGYIGRALAESRYVTFPVVPDGDGVESWIDGGRRTVCLVARADGVWMDQPARGSGE